MKKEKNIKKIKFPWIIYGILFAPLELLIAYFSFLSKGEAIGLWVSLKIIVILSFVFLLIPIIARLIFKIFKKDFFDMTDIVKAIVPALVGLVILWIVAVLYATKNEGLIAKILAVVFLMPIAILPHGIIFYIMYMFAGLVSGDKEFYDSLDRSSSQSKSKSEKKMTFAEELEKNFGISFKHKDIYDENGHLVARTHTMKNGRLETTEAYDNFGNSIGSSDTINFEGFSETTIKNKNGKKIGKYTEYK